MAAVEHGDMEAAQRMVDQAAKAAGEGLIAGQSAAKWADRKNQ